ncbi:metallophosphoesterase [Paenibacillus sp. LHD-38]|uniref:metallophosphoesterase n=1 Tax=Paenibacillus sp. LHD-38 TaxID=3072143 RepID=UPI00280F7869|nr:metallophosphoesterase [Paenibacillus sp. LHD-38]MDQ8734372.1 metallophosphoesterase [Paenibacillus sp. LHD-38]
MTKKRWLILIPVIILAVIAFLYYENNAIGITRYQLSSDKLPDGFDTYRIVQLTDLHSKSFGKEQSVITRKVKKLKPDLIVMTGDLVDSRRYNAEISLTLMRKMTELAPVYYVTGNHEWGSRFPALAKGLKELGVHVMRNTSELVKLGDGEIRITGVDDPTFNHEADGDVERINEHIGAALEEADLSKERYSILLSHRPELFSEYVRNQFDLTFSGHAHGGQVRLPFLGGLVAPGQGFLPRYDGGKYTEGETTMIVSRGLGNSIIPQRLFNRPEVVLVELTAARGAASITQ